MSSQEPQWPITYLTVEDIIGLHAFVVERTGTTQLGIRDENALASAVNRPRAASYYGQADLITQAARLAAGLSRAQAFVDGNKRVAYLAADVFLRVNGIRYAGAPMDLARQIEQLAHPGTSADAADSALDAWLRAHVEPID